MDRTSSWTLHSGADITRSPTHSIAHGTSMFQELDIHNHRKPAHTAPLPHTPSQAHGIPLLEHNHPPLRFARRHHSDVPRHDESGYAHYKDMREIALANAIRELEDELGSRCGIKCLELQNQQLIVHRYSQSKLSQQELADLQKATHFDKKELQQWYKGAHAVGQLGWTVTEYIQAS